MKKLFLPVVTLELIIVLSVAMFLFNSCASTSLHAQPREALKLSRRILDQGQLSADQLAYGANPYAAFCLQIIL